MEPVEPPGRLVHRPGRMEELSDQWKYQVKVRTAAKQLIATSRQRTTRKQVWPEIQGYYPAPGLS